MTKLATSSSSPSRAQASASSAGPDCPDLRAIASGLYRVGMDPAHFAEHGDRSRAVDPWLLVIRGRYGEVFPYGGQQLAASTNCRGPVSFRLGQLPGAIIRQDGDDGVTVSFPVAMFDQIAGLLQLRRKRQVSDAERQRLANLSARHGFSRASTHQ